MLTRLAGEYAKLARPPRCARMERAMPDPPGSTLAKPAHRPDLLREGRVWLEAVRPPFRDTRAPR